MTISVASACRGSSSSKVSNFSSHSTHNGLVPRKYNRAGSAFCHLCALRCIVHQAERTDVAGEPYAHWNAGFPPVLTRYAGDNDVERTPSRSQPQRAAVGAEQRHEVHTQMTVQVITHSSHVETYSVFAGDQ